MTEPTDPSPVVAPAESAGSAATNADAAQGGRAAHVARTTGSLLLIAVGVLALVLSLPAIWGRNLVLNTDRYVQTLSPLASNPGVQSGIINAVDRQIDGKIQVGPLIAQVLPPKAAKAVTPPLQSATQVLVNKITTSFVQSTAFQKLWDGLNRVTHKQIVFILTGTLPEGIKQIKALKVQNGEVTLDLTQVVNGVKSHLGGAGVTVASKVPAVGTVIKIANVKGLESARNGVKALNTLADWLPWIGLALIAGGIALARRRRRALIYAALGLTGGMIVIGVVLLVARNVYLSSLPHSVFSTNTSSYIFDTVVRYLRDGLRLLLVIGLVVAACAFITGRPATMAMLRRGGDRLHAQLLRKAPANPFTLFLGQHTVPLAIGIIGLGFFVLLMVNTVSVGLIVLLSVIVGLLLLALFVLRSPQSSAATVDGTPAG